MYYSSLSVPSYVNYPCMHICTYLSIPLHVCISDIDECADDNGGCQQVCNNVPGSYTCSCNDGFQLDEDEHSCRGTQTN